MSADSLRSDLNFLDLIASKVFDAVGKKWGLSERGWYGLREAREGAPEEKLRGAQSCFRSPNIKTEVQVKHRRPSVLPDYASVPFREMFKELSHRPATTFAIRQDKLENDPKGRSARQ